MRKNSGAAPLVILIIVLLAAGVAYLLGTQKGAWQSPASIKLPSLEKEDPKTIARKLVVAVREKDMAQVAGYVHPQKGLRFAPYINLGSKDKVFTADQVKGLAVDTIKYTWGVQDGSGFPLTYTFAEYWAKYIYDKNYSSSNQISQDKAIGKGNTLDNFKEFYPESTFVEYFVPGTGETADFDWGALRFVFVQENGKFYLVAIVHNGWTI